MQIGAREILLVLALGGVAALAVAQTPPARVLRPEPASVLVRYPAQLAPDDRPEVTMLTATDLYPDVEATVTSNEVVVSLSVEESEGLEAVGQLVPAGAAFLLIAELTIGGRVHRNLVAPIPVAFEVELDGDVWYTTVLNVGYIPPAYRDRSLDPDSWVVNIAGRSFPVTDLQPWPPADDIDPPIHGDTVLELTLDGSIPYRAEATVLFFEEPNAEPRFSVSGRTPDAPPGRLANFVRDLDVYTGFMFTSSEGTNATFGLVTHFRRPFLFSAFGQRNQFLFGPRATFRTNSSDQDDEDSILLSVPIEIRHFPGALVEREGVEAPLISTIVFDVGPTVESDKSLRNYNLISDSQLSFQFSTQGATGRRGALSGYALDFRPHVGFEAGRSLGDGTVGFAGGSIGRLKVGMAGQLVLEFENPHLRAIVLDVGYEYRRLYTEETISRWVTTTLPAVTVTTTGGVTSDTKVVSRTLITSTGGRSRRYLNAAVRFVFSRYWEIFTSYGKGELPPRFISVDKIQAGFAFRFGAPY